MTMQRMRLFTIVGVVICTLVIMLAGLLGATRPAHAQEQEVSPVVGTGMVCNTQAQMESLVRLKDKYKNWLIAMHSKEFAFGPTACAPGTLVFIPMEPVGHMAVADGEVVIVPITVVAILVGPQVTIPVRPPQKLFTIIFKPMENI